MSIPISELGQGIGRGNEADLSNENKASYFVGRKIPLEEREKLWQEPTPPLPEGSIEPVLTSNAIHVLERRYLGKENGKVVETPQEMFWRVADSIARVETLYGDNEEERKKLAEERRLAFYEMMARLEFLPNSPTLMNAGRRLQQLSACFVIPVEDSMESIFEAVKAGALVHQSGGGTGYSFSRLRHKGDIVKSTGGFASGPLSFMEVFDAATNTVIQGGTRRGANMGMLRIDHPDILDFIKAKDEPRRFENFNLSVALTEDYMDAVRKGEKYSLISPRTGEVVKQLDAKEVFELIVERAWRRGDPGIVFIDRINKKNPTSHLGKIESTNPCGEQPLLPFESCNLGSINLAKFVKDGDIDRERLKETVHLAVNFLDNVIDANKYTIPEIEEITMGNRKIGLGIMGLADMLVLLQLGYETDGGRAKAREVMKFIQDEGHKASMELAKKRGVFPNFKGSIFDKEDGSIPMRNATVTTIAPTGTIGIIAGCSGQGCEPFYRLSFIRKHRLGETDEDNIMEEVNPYFEEAMKKEPWGPAIIKAVKEKGMLSEIEGFEIPEEEKSIFKTAHEITGWGHLKTQAALQEFVDNAVSKTINLPNSATKEDIAEIYLLADELNCKGITIYRDESREEQVFYLKEKEAGGIIERPEVYQGKTYKTKTPVGTAFITVNREIETGEVREVFVDVGKAGSELKAQAEMAGRLLSFIFRIPATLGSKTLIEGIVDQLENIGGSEAIGFGPDKVRSLPDAIARVLKKEIETENKPSNRKFGEFCPDCGYLLIPGEGCSTCRVCGYGRCD